MRRASSMEAFLSDPVGRVYVGATHVMACHSPTLCGSVHWGRPTLDEVVELTQLFDFSRHPALAGGFDVWMDSRGVEFFDWRAFTILSEYVNSRLAEWGQLIRRQAVLVPEGPVAAVMAGMVPLLGMTYPLRFFSAPGAAREWIDRPDLHAFVEELEPLASEARGIAPVVRAVRLYLERSLHDATVEGAARSVGLSPRSLQRELRRWRTHFSAELIQARVQAACSLLAHSDEKVEVIARRVGCVSSSQLGAIFRRHVGQTPARYRERVRASRI